MSLCHGKQFGSYCVEAVERQFRETPLDMTRKKCNKVFHTAYNRSRDFRLFQQNNKLQPKGYYYAPACLKTKLRDMIYELEEEQEEHISGKREFTTLKEIGPLPDIESPTQVLADETQSERDFESYAKETNQYTYDCEELCKDCGHDQYTCHAFLFAEYCIDNVVRQFDLYPVAMNRKVAMQHFVSKYYDALHFYTFDDSSVFARRSFHVPPRCLEREMLRVTDDIHKMHSEHLESHMSDKLTEPLETTMDFDGLEVEDYIGTYVHLFFDRIIMD